MNSFSQSRGDDRGPSDRIIRVELPGHPHTIEVGVGNLSRIGERLSSLHPPCKVAIVSDDNTGPLYKGGIVRSLSSAGFDVTSTEVPAGEKSKCLGELERLYEFFAQSKLERQSIVVALGGGVVGDLAGFASATYLRGTRFVQLGTSVVAQVDSSIGGKVGINLRHGKNLAGSFHQPDLVLSDITVLQSLPDEEYIAGLAEVVKYGVIRDPNLFDLLDERSEEVLGRNLEVLLEIVERSSRIKAQVVVADEKEGGLRRILNFGHTLGHALESMKGYGVLRHGEAVAIGMVGATRIAQRMDLCTQETTDRLEHLLQKLRLPTKAPFEASLEDLLVPMSRDKKVRDGKLVFVLPRRIGDVTMVDSVKPETIEAIAPTITSGSER